MALPEMSAPGVSPSRVWVRTVLPLPDSPTIPSVRPASTLNDTPRTALTTPSAVGELTVRSVTSNRVTAIPPAGRASGVTSLVANSVSVAHDRECLYAKSGRKRHFRPDHALSPA